jgi:LPS O-antigen subunit length determinant protein (WzzB/FepE family)
MEEEKELTIDFAALWEVIKKGKWFIALTGLIFALVTATIVFNQPNEYTSTASVMPELESSSAGGLSKFAGLASLAGVDLSSMSSSDAIRPDLYPSVINNTSFFLYLLEQDVKTSEKDNENFLDFYIGTYELEEDTITTEKGLLSSFKEYLGISPKVIVKGDSSSSDFIYLPKYKGKIIEELKEKIVADMDKKTGIISVSVELPDPVTAAHVAKISMDYLTGFVTNYRTEKSRQDLVFLAQQLGSAKGKYYNTQSKKAQYSDQFQSATIRLQVADVQRERIEADYRVSSTFYTELMKQYESAKMDLQKQTPVFKTLEQPVIPYEKSGPRRSIALVIFSIMGVVTGTTMVLFTKNNYKKVIIISNINEFE